MAGKLGEVFGGVVAAQHRCTHRAGSLAEGNNQNIGLHAGGCGAAFSLIAEHAEAVGIIEQQPSAVLAAQAVQAGQVGAIAIHAEHALARHQRAAAGILRQQRGELVILLMGKAAERSGGKRGGFLHRSVAIFVGQQHIVFAQEAEQHRLIGGIAAGKHKRALIAQPAGQKLLQRFVGIGVAAHQRRAAAAAAEARERLLPGGNHAFIAAQAQIIVAAEIEQARVIKVDFGQRHIGAARRAAAVGLFGGLCGQIGVDSGVPVHGYQ